MSRTHITTRRAFLLISIVALAITAVPIDAFAVDHGGVVNVDPNDDTISFLDGEVLALAEVGDKVIVGGDFTHVGPAMLGAAGVVDLATSTFGDGFPDVDGVVVAVVADGAGGWYLGGQFSSAGGEARANAAHVDASGAVTGWNPAPNGRVETLSVSPGGIVMGGSFTAAGGVSRSNLALVDPTSGAAVAEWDPVVSGSVLEAALSGDGNRLYIGGSFLTVDGTARKRLAAVSTSTGALDAGFLPGVVNLPVRAMVERNGTLYVGGDFTSIAGIQRRRLATMDSATGGLRATDPAVNGRVKDLAISGDGSTLFAVGAFGTVGGQARSLVAALSASTLAPTSLSIAGIFGSVDAVTVLDAGRIAIGGTFHIVPKKDRPQRLAAVATSSGAISALVPAPATPRSLTRPASSTSGVLELTLAGGRLAVGGDFSDYGVVARPYLVAMDANTGALDRSFAPAPDDPVLAVAGSSDGGAVFVGGEFTHIGSTAATRVAKLDIDTGQPVAGFSTSADSKVRSLVPVGDRVFVGGSFNAINGSTRSNFGAVDATSGALDPNVDLPITDPTGRSEDGGIRAMAATSDGSRLMLLYNAATIGGVHRQGVAQVDLTTSPVSVSPWSTSLYDYQCKTTVPRPLMRDLAISPDDSYAVVVTSGDNYPPGCDTAVAFPVAASGPVQPLWVNKMRDTLEAVAISDSAVYVGGHFRSADNGALSRFQVAALSPSDGRALAWDPSADGFHGVVELNVTSRGLLLGSDGDTVGGEPHGRFAFFEAPAPNATPQAAFTASCTSLTCTFDGSSSSDPGGSVTSYAWEFGDGSVGTGPVVQHSFPQGGRYTVRLRATDGSGGTDAAYRTVVVASEPVAIAHRAATGTSGNRASFTVKVPSSVQLGDAMVLFLSLSNSTSVVGQPAGLSGWQTLGQIDVNGMRTLVWWRTAQTGDANRSVSVGLSAMAKADVSLVAYDGTDPIAPIAAWQAKGETQSRPDHTTPTVESTTDGAWVVSYWADKNSATTTWTAPAGDVVRRMGLNIGSGRVTTLLSDDATAHGPGTQGGRTATADAPAAKATMWTLVLRPAS